MGFYEELFTSGGSCIGCGNGRDYDRWLKEMQNRHAGTVLPEGFVREGFCLCCEAGKLAGVYSFKFERTESLLNCGGRVGYAAEILRQGLILAKGAGFDRFLAVCDKDNLASEKVILKNGEHPGRQALRQGRTGLRKAVLDRLIKIPPFGYSGGR